MSLKIMQRGDGSIYITALVPDGPAAKAGNLVVGDRIQSVNGQPFESIQHVEAVRALSAPGALHVSVAQRTARTTKSSFFFLAKRSALSFLRDVNLSC